MPEQPSDILQFGIPTVDWLFGTPTQPKPALTGGNPDDFVSIHTAEGFGIRVEPNHTTSLCVIGPDGTGKSLLALHFAARYAWRSHQTTGQMPRILYASTDLSHGKAAAHWNQFGLHYFPHISPFPWRQEKNRAPIKFTLYHPIGGEPASLAGKGKSKKSASVARQPQAPPLAEYFQPGGLATGPSRAEVEPEVAFINLESATAGDDWGFLNRVIALLPPVSPNPNVPHLLVVDAVEGLETMVGETDAYGQTRPRRSRIAQLFRTAAGKCHLFFVCEESAAERLPEEFVTDVVIRLHNRSEFDYHRRTLEITKARGQWHTRGEHPYVIRKGGLGSSTVEYANPDDPPPADGYAPQCYILAFPSLDARYRDVMVRHRGEQGSASAQSSTPEPEELKNPPPFGVPGLNRILQQGLTRGGVTALIGEEGTYRSRLGRNFLSQCFLDVTAGNSPDTSQKKLLDTAGVGILLTNQDHFRPDIQRRIGCHLRIAELAGDIKRAAVSQLDKIKKRLIYRRLETHHITSPILFHIIEQTVEDARRRLRLLMSPGNPDGPREEDVTGESWRIRLVIDDWTQITRAYPEVQRDTRFLPFLLFFLRRKNITTLVIDTHPGDPDTVKGIERDRDLPSLVERRLYAWRLPFFGAERVAIRSVPPLSSVRPASVQELLPEGRSHHERLAVDSEFDLYDFSVTPPRPVPLDVRLHVEESSHQPEAWRLTRRLFQELFRLHARLGRKQMLRVSDSAQYEAFRDFCHLQGSAPLDHTLVAQVDEFWGTVGSAAFADLTEYLSRSLGEPMRGPVCEPPNEAPFGTFPGCTTRGEAFRPNCEGYQLPGELPSGLNRIPYMWDFGFLICARDPWERAALGSAEVRQVKDHLFFKVSKPGAGGRKPVPVSWRDFLAACSIVADFSRKAHSVPFEAFDVDLHATSETMSCLFLEVWLSEIAARGNDLPAKTKAFLNRLSGRHLTVVPPGDPHYGLADLAREHEYELFRTWLLLGDFITPAQFPADNLRFTNPPVAGRPQAAATRHWYSTAAIAHRKQGTDSPGGLDLIPARLPGWFAVRGDWDLAIAKGSLSTRLGERALDLLSSRRANVERLRQGLGLPTRDIMPQECLGQAWTCLWTLADGQPRRLYYSELKGLGAIGSGFQTSAPEFAWLWRSSLRDYYRTSRFWVIWLCSLRERWQAIRRTAYPDARDGLAAYDECVKSAKLKTKHPGYARFSRRVRYLRDGLGLIAPPA
jgi:KaiC/GvpD/RAD55 family RecA-like ATPase